VAKLVRADDALHRHPHRCRRPLGGRAARGECNAPRLWLKTHIEKLLGPLFDLARPRTSPGIARGIRVPVIEARAWLERATNPRPREDLDQPSRATNTQIRRALRGL